MVSQVRRRPCGHYGLGRRIVGWILGRLHEARDAAFGEGFDYDAGVFEAGLRTSGRAILDHNTSGWAIGEFFASEFVAGKARIVNLVSFRGGAVNGAHVLLRTL